MNPEFNQMPPRQEERQEEQKKNGNTVLLTVIGVATLLVALVGATFAYFTATASNTNNQSVTIQAGKAVGLEYKAVTQIKMTNAQPGQTANGKFTVKNNDTVNAYTYDLKLIINSNTFNNYDGNGQLLLSFTSSASQGTAPKLAGFTTPTDVTQTAYKKNGASFDLVNDAQIAVGVTHTYDSLLNFVETHSTQNSNQEKVFAAHIDISDIRTTGSST